MISFLFTEEPIEFVRELKEQTVTEIPGTATFECELSKAGLRVQWLKGDEPISSGDKYDITADGTVHRLVVRDVTGDDVNTYTATVRGKTSSAPLAVEGLYESLSCVHSGAVNVSYKGHSYLSMTVLRNWH